MTCATGACRSSDSVLGLEIVAWRPEDSKPKLNQTLHQRKAGFKLCNTCKGDQKLFDETELFMCLIELWST